MRKYYISPMVKTTRIASEQELLALSLDPTKDAQSITPDDSQLYDGEFGARQATFGSVWDE
ncbi:MAG: hypothetical protein J6I34_04290 [Prevotella sp.]|nr:hypothetical protein [Prevotella sp.]